MAETNSGSTQTRISPLRALRGGPTVILGVTTIGAVGAIIYSHYAQLRDKAEMRTGVERDKERLRLKRKMQRESERQQEATLGSILQKKDHIKIKSDDR